MNKLTLFAISAALSGTMMQVQAQCAPSSVVRFAAADGNVVHDYQHRLMWVSCALDPTTLDCAEQQQRRLSMSGVEALKAAQQVNFGGYSDWRLPNIKELAALLGEPCVRARAEVVFSLPKALRRVWSATTAESGSYAGLLVLSPATSEIEAWSADYAGAGTLLVRDMDNQK
ncbi:DUF1566 domain-containing protein [Pseudoalteromonas viridis]|uniref:DUF1566 domain-containing protein n=1 Tax=Pseudoalteromonas viridis TaxID=339617 RepID=A0ABX7V3N0_9GAMM|nr:DUF1566 domain-containing protein [Pseudoalteromonas viridis]QTL35503.1 DUF1566 domain-containing protein [Pseudoalteromonas viridis]